MRARTRARGWVLQILYAWESRGSSESIAAIRAEFFRDRLVAESSRAYIVRLSGEVEAHIADIDHALQDALTNWRLERLAAIDRNILRLSAAELMYAEDVPPRVSIQEAILLAEKYGTSDSPRFVNGVLDALMHRLGLAEQRSRATGDAL